MRDIHTIDFINLAVPVWLEGYAQVSRVSLQAEIQSALEPGRRDEEGSLLRLFRRNLQNMSFPRRVELVSMLPMRAEREGLLCRKF